MRFVKFLMLSTFCSLMTFSLGAQELEVNRDSTNTTPAPTDSIKVTNSSGIETTIKYFAEDSIITKTATNITYLYGNAYIEYGDIKLDAARIVIDREKSELTATGIQDSTGSWIGLPIFKDGGDVYETREIRYNFQSNRAKIKGVATKQPDGYLAGDEVKRNEDGSAYILDGKFVPCADPLATTYIKSKKVKIIPGKSVVTGPFILYVGGIPTFLGLPFGIFPDTQESSSGIIFPKYGTEKLRGIFLREAGYYFAFNDYIHTALTADFYSKGSIGLRAQTTYQKRYRYSGSFNFTYNRNKSDAIDETPLDSRDFWLSWSHRPESRGKSRFSASVNAGSSTFNQNNISTTNFSRNVRSEFSSNISYSSSITGTPFSYSINARHNQNVQTGIVDVTLPEMSVNMNRIYPFKNSKADIMKKLNVGWAFNITNRVSNLVKATSTSFDVVNPVVADTIAVTFGDISTLLDNAQSGARHTVPISTSFPLLKHLNVTPSITFSELWYLEELSYVDYDGGLGGVQINKRNGFSRASTYSSSLGVSTQLYGMYQFKPGKRIEAIRHIMRPSIGFTYRPDYSQEKFGYFQDVVVDADGNTRQLSIYDGFIFGSPSLGETAAMGFNLSNNLEMKVRSDTSSSKKVAILENLTFSTAYNFLAEEFKLSTINITGRTSLFNKKVSINFGATVDPYTYVETFNSENNTTTTTRTNTFAWKGGQGLGRLTSARFSLSTSLNSKSSAGNQSFGNISGPTDLGGGLFGGEDNDFGSINDGGGDQNISTGPTYAFDPNAYIDLSIPWNLRFSYDYNFNRGLTSTTTRQAVKAYGQISLTPKWRVTMNTGYDIDLKEFTQTSIGVYRDLGCWEMRANWIPFGRFTSYNIDIQIKASALKDLKLSRRRSFFDTNF